ncbi:MAG: sugar-transfer associated ATP-grasp domain-containing protein [Pseudomonadota bacterium]
MEDDAPLRLGEHLRLREQLSTVQPSSIIDVWRATPAGNKLDACTKFINARFGPGKLSSGEFIQFGFCNAEAENELIEKFAGKQAQQAFNKIYNDRTWYALTKNKLAFEALMRGGGLPCPETMAIYDRKGRGAGAPVLKTKDELGAFLLSHENHPVFCKPTTGLLSIGSFRVDDVTSNQLVVNEGHQYPLSEVVEYIQGISRKGYLFQRVLEPHPDFAAIGCDVISSVRFLVFNRERESSIHSCVLKIPASGEVADNFWRSGSIIASVDLGTGKFDRAVLKTRDGVECIHKTPPDKKHLFEFQLPNFADASKCVLEASRFLAGVRVQSWDVALTKKGPVLLEVNFGGDLNLSQLSSGKGIMDKSYCDVLRESGYSGRLPS